MGGVDNVVGVAPAEPAQSVDQVFALPPGQARMVDDLLADEQWLANIGARAIITGLASADWNDIRRGTRKLRHELELERGKGYRAGYEKFQAERASEQTTWRLFALAAGAIGMCFGWVIGVAI